MVSLPDDGGRGRRRRKSIVRGGPTLTDDLELIRAPFELILAPKVLFFRPLSIHVTSCKLQSHLDTLLLCYPKSAIMVLSGQKEMFPATWVVEGGPEVRYTSPSTSWTARVMVGSAPVVFHGGGVVAWVVEKERMKFRVRESILVRERHFQI